MTEIRIWIKRIVLLLMGLTIGTCIKKEKKDNEEKE